VYPFGIIVQSDGEAVSRA